VDAFSYAQYFYGNKICLVNKPKSYINFVLTGNVMLMHQTNDNLVKEHLFIFIFFTEKEHLFIFL
jgi:hypothetical protein